MFRITVALLAATIMTGCATGFKQPATGSNYGAYPENYETLVKQSFDETLIDPESARFRFLKPRKGYSNRGWALGGDVVWQGYLVQTRVNAKNRFGGYTGFKSYVLMVRDGHVSRVLARNDLVITSGLLHYSDGSSLR